MPEQPVEYPVDRLGGLTEETVSSQVAGLDGILVPGGFGSRGIEGMVLAAQYARENRVPYLGICLGMQIAVMEFARHAAELSQANSGEFDPDCPQKVIDFMPGRTMRSTREVPCAWAATPAGTVGQPPVPVL